MGVNKTKSGIQLLETIIQGINRDFPGVVLSENDFFLNGKYWEVSSEAVHRISDEYGQHLRQKRNEDTQRLQDSESQLIAREGVLRGMNSIPRHLKEAKESLHTAQKAFDELKSNTGHPEFASRQEKYNTCLGNYNTLLRESIARGELEEGIRICRDALQRRKREEGEKHSEPAIGRLIDSFQKYLCNIHINNEQDVIAVPPKSSVISSRICVALCSVLMLGGGVMWKLHKNGASNNIQVLPVGGHGMMEQAIVDEIGRSTDSIINTALLHLKNHGSLELFHQEMETQLHTVSVRLTQCAGDVKKATGGSSSGLGIYVQYQLPLDTEKCLDVTVFQAGIVQSLSHFCTQKVHTMGIDTKIGDCVKERLASSPTVIDSDPVFRQKVITTLAPLKGFVSKEYQWSMQTEIFSTKDIGDEIQLHVPYLAYGVPGTFTVSVKKPVSTLRIPQ